MESIAPHSLGVEAVRNGEMIGHGPVAAVKRGIETGDLRQFREARQNRADRREIVGLMQRRQRNIALKLGQHSAVDADWLVVIRAAVDDTMTDRQKIELLRFTQPGSDRLDSGRHVRNRFGLKCAVDERGSAGTVGTQPRPCPDAVHLPLDQPLKATPFMGVVDLEFHARRAGIDDEDRVHVTPPVRPLSAAARRHRVPLPHRTPCGRAPNPRARSG